MIDDPEIAADLQLYAEACKYPGVLDESRVEAALTAYVAALGLKCRVVRLRRGWTLEEHPSLKRHVEKILANFVGRLKYSDVTVVSAAVNATFDAAVTPAGAGAEMAARATDAARAALRTLLPPTPIPDACRAAARAREAFAASIALAAQAGIPIEKMRFARWCLARTWVWAWDLSRQAATAIGAKRLRKTRVLSWAGPIFDAFVAGAWHLYWTDDTLYWIAKPTMHMLPRSGRLHNEHGPAFESDVENLYFWYGVLVPDFVVDRPAEITVRHIEDENNAEVRRVMIERYRHGEELHGAAAYLRDAGGRVLDHDEMFGTLHFREVKDDEPIVILEMVNRTREADGSWKHYFERVPPDMRTARQAWNWQHGYTPHFNPQPEET